MSFQQDGLRHDHQSTLGKLTQTPLVQYIIRFVSSYFPFNTYYPFRICCKRPKATKEKDERTTLHIDFYFYFSLLLFQKVRFYRLPRLIVNGGMNEGKKGKACREGTKKNKQTNKKKG